MARMSSPGFPAPGLKTNGLFFRMESRLINIRDPDPHHIGRVFIKTFPHFLTPGPGFLNQDGGETPATVNMDTDREDGREFSMKYRV